MKFSSSFFEVNKTGAFSAFEKIFEKIKFEKEVEKFENTKNCWKHKKLNCQIMYEIKAWCFLCASDKNDVSVEINSLDDCLKELIGTFSIINFNLVSSQICVDCHCFLKEHERRKELYSKVEAMYMEILKERNKPAVDVRAIRAKHQIDNEIASNFMRRVDQEPEFNIIQFEINEVEVDELIQTDEIVESPPPRLSKRRPKLLNPTLVESSKLQTCFDCDLCSFSSPSKVSLARHLNSTHKKQSESSPRKRMTVNRLTKDFKCSNCFKSFATVK